MIIGECPYCDETNMTPIGPAPCFTKETCERCGREYWLKHSRWNPIAYPLDSVKVDEETMQVIHISTEGSNGSD